MSERWVKATYCTDEDCGIDKRDLGKPCWINMRLVARITEGAYGTRLETSGRMMGPFSEGPSHFIGPDPGKFVRGQ